MSYSQQEEIIKIPFLPLAVYREIAAHLQQLDAVEVEIMSQSSTAFSYDRSQVEGLRLTYPSTLATEEKQRLQEILNYYEKRHGQWEKSQLTSSF